MPVTNLEELLSKVVKVPEGQTLSDLINSDEEIKLNQNEDVKIYNSDDFNTLISNQKKEAETAGREKVLKEMKEELALDYEGRKDPKNFINALTTKIKTETLEEAKVEPSKKIEGLTKDLDSLRTQLAEKENEITSLSGNITKIQTQSLRNELISKALPEKTVIDKSDVQTLITNSVDLRFEDNKPVIYKDGEMLKDDLRNPVDALEHLKGITQKYAVQSEPGGGGGDEPGGGGNGTLEAFDKRMESKGLSPGGAEYMKELGEAQSRGEIKL